MPFFLIMATALQYINTILRYTGELTDYSDATPNAIERALEKLNEYVEMLREKGCTLNSSQVQIENINQNVNFPTYAKNCIELNVAKLLWPIANPGVPMTLAIDRGAQKAETYLIYKYGPDRGSKFPGTLPKGSGNRNMRNTNSGVLYPNFDPPIYDYDSNGVLTETESNIITED